MKNSYLPVSTKKSVKKPLKQKYIFVTGGVVSSIGKGLTAASLGAWTPPDAAQGKEALLKAITTLDDAYEAGHVDEAIYEERRAILTERLLPLLDEEER